MLQARPITAFVRPLNPIAGLPMTSIAIRALFAAVLLLGAQLSLAAEARTVVGAWEMCEDPDGGPKDFLRFEADGTGTLLHREARTPFTYTVDGLSLVLIIHIGDERPDEARLAISEDGRKIMAFDARTGNTSTYVREADVDEFECTLE